MVWKLEVHNHSGSYVRHGELHLRDPPLTHPPSPNFTQNPKFVVFSKPSLIYVSKAYILNWRPVGSLLHAEKFVRYFALAQDSGLSGRLRPS